MKDIRALMQYAAQPHPMAPAWQNPLWEGFIDEDLEDDEPPLDAEIDDLARGDK